MKVLRLFLLVIFSATFALQSQAKSRKEKAPEVLTIYVFGVSQDLSDSIIYMTDILPVAGATMLPHEILDNHQYYSEQLKKYMENTLHLQHQTVTFYYSRKRQNIEKQFVKVQEKTKKHSAKMPVFKQIASEDFRFKVPVLVVAGENE